MRLDIYIDEKEGRKNGKVQSILSKGRGVYLR